MRGTGPDRRFVGVLHEFHDPGYARDWSERFTPSPPREAMFATLLAALRGSTLPAPRVLELGTGPGYFAERLLRDRPDLRYLGLDYSRPMLELAADRLAGFAARVELVQADLCAADWPERFPGPWGAIVSTWALHDLGSEARTASVYAACGRLLEPGGLLLNGDFVKPDGTRHDYEGGRFPVARHLQLLAAAGFASAQCLGFWELELEAPTTAQNYACLLGVR